MKKVTYLFAVLLHKKVKLSAVFLLLFGLTNLPAQEAIVTSGGNATGSTSVSYSIGQIVYTTNIGTIGSTSQGVQQPYEISVMTGIKEAVDISLEFIAYPNPATDFVKLKINNFEFKNLRYQLYDINGSLLQDNKVDDIETTITMQNIKPSTYFLKILQGNREIKTFKIIKN
jgi:hypothetical protein